MARSKLRIVGVAAAVVLASIAWLALRPRVAPAPPGAPNFLVIAPDTLRADRLDADRGGAPVTPNLRRLAARGTRFTQAISQSGWTLPALAALQSGRYPLAPQQVHGQQLNFLRSDLATLPEALSAAGYRTAVFWGQSISGLAPEFSRGFEHVETRESAGYEAALLTWLDEPDDRPFFALVHNVDLQFPVVGVPGEPLLSGLPEAGARGIDALYQDLLPRSDPPRATAAARAAYDATVTGYDAAIGRILDGVTARGLDANTVIVATSNHGLDLGEHGNFWHGAIYDTNLRVPLVIVDPGGPRGASDDTVVQTIDLAPTLLARAGVAAPQMVGQSLLPLLGGPGVYTEHEVYSFASAQVMSVRTRAWKLARLSRQQGAGAEEPPKIQLFDLRADPGELQEDRRTGDREVTELRERLEVWWAERVAETARSGTGVPTTERLKQALRENGYWGLVEGK